MRLRAVLLAALTTGALLHVPAVAAENQIILTGTRSGWVDVDTMGEIGVEPPVITTNGRFGGFYVEQISTHPGYGTSFPGGWVGVRGLSPRPDRLDQMRIGGAPQTFRGRIRLYLIADGKTTVTIRTRNFQGGRYAVKHPTQVHLRLTPLAQRGEVWQATSPLRLAKKAVALAAVHVTGDGSALSDVAVCLRDAQGPCPDYDPLLPHTGTAAGGGFGPEDSEQRWEYAPYAGFHSGNVVASATVDPELPVRRAVLAAFSLTLAS